MNDTPRTDAHTWHDGDYDDPFHAFYDFARTLERELNAANDKIKQLEDNRTKAAANSLANMLAYEDAIAKIKRLEEAGDALKAAHHFGGWADAVNKWVKIREEQP